MLLPAQTVIDKFDYVVVRFLAILELSTGQQVKAHNDVSVKNGLFMRRNRPTASDRGFWARNRMRLATPTLPACSGSQSRMTPVAPRGNGTIL